VPELPEVETIKTELAPQIIGRKFTDLTIHDAKPIKQPSLLEFRRRLIGQIIAGLERRGKYLIFCLAGGEALIIHFRMTGSLLLNPGQTGSYARIIFQFDDGNQLVYIDRRRLGRLWLVRDEKSVTDKLGPEPLEPEFTVETLSQRLHRRKAPIKAVLLDQGFVAGIGKIGRASCRERV
jgi:formamidopyrimidine-DNA glycosylase